MPRSKRVIALAATAALLAAVAACASDIDRAVGTATGFVSHQLCSAVFVSKLDPDEFYQQAIAPSGGPIGFLFGREIDYEHTKVSATFAGLGTSEAVYRGQLGCLISHGPPAPAVDIEAPAPAAPAATAPTDPRLTAALDHVFAETAEAPHRWTKAVVILHDGKIVAERYAPGYGVDTPIAGWSMTKSVTNALIGILVRQGKLSVNGPAPVAAWADPADPRHTISIDNLLRMASGLDIGDSVHAGFTSIFDRSTQMLFVERDMAGFAMAAPRTGPAWRYADGNTLLLSRIIRDQVGGDAAAVIGFARRELFDKLGMQHVTLEFDATGTPIGSSHMFAPARAWARLGQLFLDDGMAGGDRILPAGWADYSATLTPGSETYGYGAGFWTNRGDSDGARIRLGFGLPADAYMARGSFGQYVVIVPSARLVVARLGLAYTPYDDMETVARLVAETVGALGASAMR
ncbi:class C beta-lactamase-related serine hydrolase [Oleomonas cavernae]|uniref:Class C beta-lactamase-related serine hydrolase n=1 Tax=Oleomonas cavernae TaxID=2320859 RepID=A0A418WCX9_9PROT|nr:serine hydrolase [Oleomonas cavernae]RJF87844.1 class C beta-lactamase-related serine hydrolase [Oleomonas cavernae]